MKEETQYRVVRKAGSGNWQVRTGTGEYLPLEEKENLKEYLNEIQLNYHEVDMQIQIDGGIDWNSVEERLRHFYAGIAEVTPF